MKDYFLKLKKSRSFFSFMGLIIICIIFSLWSDKFFTMSNILTIFRQSSILLVLSAGLTAVIITGGIDLSTGTVAGFVGCVCAQLLKLNVPVVLVIIIGILSGGLIGLFNGVLVGVIKLPPFIATYGTRWVVGGLSIIVMNGAVIYDLPKGFTNLGVGYIGLIPNIIIIAVIVVIITYFLLQKTILGRNIYSIGSNKDAALYSGVNVKKTLFIAFILSGATSGLAGILMTARLNAAEAAMGDAYGLQMVAAVIIGGTSMLGGEGGIIGTIIGALLLTVIVNAMNLMGVSSFTQPLVVGVVIIGMVLFDSFNRNKSSKIIE